MYFIILSGQIIPDNCTNINTNYFCGLEEMVTIPLPLNVFLGRGNFWWRIIKKALCKSTSIGSGGEEINY